MDVLKYLLKLQFVQGYRRWLAVAFALATGVIQLLTSPDLLAACVNVTTGICGALAHVQPYLAVAAGYLGTVGVLFRNDPKPA